jgi:AraC-like DNA-binding protein
VTEKAAVKPTSSLGTVATVLDAVDRSRVDAATDTYVAALHARSVREAIRAVRNQQVSAVLVSPRCVSPAEVGEVAQLARDFPGLPMVAVLSGNDGNCQERLFELGYSGVRAMVDLRCRDGWHRLRTLVAQYMAPAASQMLSRIFGDLGVPNAGTKRFFESLVVLAPRTPNALQLCTRLHVCPSTFTSRFFRSRLPSPKRYLSSARLAHAASLLESHRLSIGDVAYRLDYSSPQSFSRHVKAVTGMTASEYRHRVTFVSALEDFANQLILPYRTIFRTFHPF